MNSKEIMDLALALASMDSIPADTAIHVNGNNMNRVLLCVDAGPAELVLAKHLGCDGVIAHHPIGKAHLNFHLVFDRHVEFMLQHGVPRNVAEDAVKKLKQRIALKTHTSIYTHVIAAAEKLDMPLMNIHLPCDELMRRILLEKLQGSNIKKVADVRRAVDQIPEFENAETEIQIPYGDPDAEIENNYALVVAAGTNGGYHVAKAYFEHGTSTVIYLHVNGEDLAKLREDNVKGNLVILGHLAGDSLGLNQLADALESKGLDIIRLGILPAA